MLIETLRILKSNLHKSLNNKDNRAKIQDADFVCGLLQAIAQADGNFSLNSLRLALCTITDCSIGSSAFNERIATASLVENIKIALKSLLTYSAASNAKESKEISEKLGVEGVIGIDGSLATLWDGLKEHFEGTFTNASVKLHLAINLITSDLCWFDLTPGAVHDSQRFPDIRKGFLYVFDLGYWSINRLKSINETGGYFLSRLKRGATLTVTEVVTKGRINKLIGKNLLNFPKFAKRGEVLELKGILSTKKAKLEVRVIGFWNKKTKQYHWYVTNLESPSKLIYDLYRLRWQIELCFKSMKSTLNFDKIPSLSPNAVLTFSLLALCNLVMASIIRAEANIHAQSSKKNAVSPSIQKATKVFRHISGQIYSLARLGSRITSRKVNRLNKYLLMLIREIFDPNFKKRKNTIERLLMA